MDNKSIVSGLSFGLKYNSDSLKAVPTSVWGGSSSSVYTDAIVCSRTYRIGSHLNLIMSYKVAIAQLSAAALSLTLLRASFNDGQ